MVRVINDGEVIVTAALPRPAAGESQWVELDSQACVAFRLDGCSLGDEQGRRRALEGELFSAERFGLGGSEMQLSPEGGWIFVEDEQQTRLAAVRYGPTEPGEVVRF